MSNQRVRLTEMEAIALGLVLKNIKSVTKGNCKYTLSEQQAEQLQKLRQFHQIEFSKRDSHQLLFDLTSSTAFEYQNFGAFSPPSDWVKVNFKNTKSSFTTFNYYVSQKTINNYIF